MYVFLFVTFLASMVTQKLSLAIASSKLPTEHQKYGKRSTNSPEPFNVKKKIQQQHIYTHSNDMNIAFCAWFINVLCKISWHIYYIISCWVLYIFYLHRYQKRRPIAFYSWQQCVFRTFSVFYQAVGKFIMEMLNHHPLSVSL